MRKDSLRLVHAIGRSSDGISIQYGRRWWPRRKRGGLARLRVPQRPQMRRAVQFAGHHAHPSTQAWEGHRIASSPHSTSSCSSIFLLVKNSNPGLFLPSIFRRGLRTSNQKYHIPDRLISWLISFSCPFIISQFPPQICPWLPFSYCRGGISPRASVVIDSGILVAITDSISAVTAAHAARRLDSPPFANIILPILLYDARRLAKHYLLAPGELSSEADPLILGCCTAYDSIAWERRPNL